MVPFRLLAVVASCLVIVATSSVWARTLPLQELQVRRPRDYAPRAASCPAQLVRPASQGVHADEKSYVADRKTAVDAALSAWLTSTGARFTLDPVNLPVLALASSGGGFRAMLTGAGVHQALDSREDNDSKLKGLYQALTYEAGLSGGGWLLSSIIGNNWPTITNLKETLWYRTLALSPLLPNQLGFLFSDADIIAAIASKRLAGFEPTLVDVYGRLLSYTLLKANEGGIKQTLSSIKALSGYATHAFPFPIITAIQAQAVQQCSAADVATQYEFTPIEFGSWDSERASFVPTEHTGSIVGADGKQNCVSNYDNLGYVLGTSSDIFTQLCAPLPQPAFDAIQQLANFSQSILGRANHRPALRDIYAPYPDTFSPQNRSAKLYPPTGRTAANELYLIDGGYSGQVNPIWPFLYREVDVLFVADSDAEAENYPDGSSIHATYVQAQARGLTRMPFIPDNNTFVARGYNKRPTFFGCDEPSPALTIIYMPNNEYVYPSNTSLYKLAYSNAEVDGMLANGQAVATNNGTAGFEVCVGCAVMKKTGASLPEPCTSCFAKYCASQ